MRIKMLRTVLLVTLLCSLALPAHARVTFGVVPAANALIRSESQAASFAAELERRLGEEVRIRLFDDEATLHHWLNRFREVDFAVLSRGYIQRQPAGEFFALAENLRSGIPGALPADPVVARQGLSPQAMRSLQYALYGMAADPAARELIGAPTAPPRPEPPPVARAVAPKAEPKPKPRPAQAEKPKPVSAPQAKPLKPQVAPAPAPAVAPETAPAPAAAPQAAETPVKPAVPQTPEPPQAAPQVQPPAPAATAQGTAKAPEPRIWIDPGRPEPGPAESPAPTAPETAAPTVAQPSIQNYSRSAGPQQSPGDQTAAGSAWPGGGLPLTTLAGLLVFMLAGSLLLFFRFRQRQSRDAFTWHATPPAGTGAAPGKNASAISTAQRKAASPAAPVRTAPKTAPPARGAAAAPKPDAVSRPAQPTRGTGTAMPRISVPAASVPRPELPAEKPPAEPVSHREQHAAAKDKRPGEPAGSEMVEQAAPLPKPAKTVEAPAPPRVLEEAPESPAEEAFPFATEQDVNDQNFKPLGPDTEVLDRYRNPFEENDSGTVSPAESAAEPADEAAACSEEGGAPPEAADLPAPTDACAEQAEPALLPEAERVKEMEAPFLPEADDKFQGVDDLTLETEPSQVELPLREDPSEDETDLEAIALAELDSLKTVAPTLDESRDDLAEPAAIELAADTEEEPLILETAGQEYSYQEHGEPADDGPVEVQSAETSEQLELETFETCQASPAEEPPAETAEPAGTAAEPPSSLNLEGNVAAIQMPALLQLVATQTRPGTLVITTRHDEKRLHFRNGRIALAASVNRATRSKTGFLMNKVGYLLIRQGKITEEQRDQALALCEKQPAKRIGETLVEMGALSHDALLEALRNQAESVIYSLFIFPEGHFRFVFEEYPLRPEDDLALDIRDLLEKARRDEGEWSNIRDAIPSLDAVLDYTPTGREKLGNARMTLHQKLVLSLIDGKRQINEICIAATMLDLEVYKFLYFMVHAKILHQVG